MTFKNFLCCSAFAFLAACSSGPLKTKVKPSNEPAYNFTQSSAVLSCLGAYIDNSNAPSVDVYISSIPDHTIPTIETGFLTKNAIMMVNTAVDRITSERLTIVGKDGGLPNRAQVQILGAFTELNRTTRSSAASGELALPGGVELELGSDRNYNHIALDIALSYKNRIVPGTSTSVSIQIDGKSGDITLSYDEGDDFAAIGALGYTGQEGFHASQRLLIETAIAIMFSRFFEVDIRQCWNENRKIDQESPKFEYDIPIFERESGADVAASDISPPPAPAHSIEQGMPAVMDYNNDAPALMVAPVTAPTPMVQPQPAQGWGGQPQTWQPPSQYRFETDLRTPQETESLRLYRNRQESFERTQEQNLIENSTPAVPNERRVIRIDR